MMKMATGEGFPLRQGARTDLDWFLVAIEACGGRTHDLGYVLEVWVYIRGFRVGNKSGGPRGGHEIGCALHHRGPLVAPLMYFFLLYIPIYPKTIGEQDRSGVPPPQASVATKNLSGDRSGTLPKGESITGGHLHHPGALHDEEGVVHPWG